uniref:Uncharacterized protein n=1 Tax=Ciona intestinalis TaxID=7719 RepID=F6S405_CIOIN
MNVRVELITVVQTLFVSIPMEVTSATAQLGTAEFTAQILMVVWQPIFAATKVSFVTNRMEALYAELDIHADLTNSWLV